MMAPDDLRSRILAGVAAHPARTRGQGRRRALVLYTLALVVMAGIFQGSGGYGHSHARPAWVSVAILVGASFIAAVGSWGAVGRRGSMNGPRPYVMVLVSLLLPAAAFFWLTAWHGTYTEPAQKFGWRCLGLTLSMGGALLASLVAVRHRTVVVQPTLQGAAAGIASGALAGVLVDAWCPLTNAAHVLHGHLLPMLLLGVVGAACGKRLLAIATR
jgi:hypothetical protein